MSKYYQKEIPESPVIVNGVSMRFDILETEDPTLIAELDKCISRGVGGVLPITAEKYADELKKKESGILSEDSLNLRRQRQELSSMQWGGLRAAVDAGNSNGQFARPQFTDGRPHTPRNQPGLPTGGVGPSGGKPMPDPIQVTSPDDFAGVFAKPPLASLKDVKSINS